MPGLCLLGLRLRTSLLTLLGLLLLLVLLFTWRGMLRWSIFLLGVFRERFRQTRSRMHSQETLALTYGDRYIILILYTPPLLMVRWEGGGDC